MTLVEISEREVIEKAKAWKAWRVNTGVGGRSVVHAMPEIALTEAVILLEERERVAENLDRDDAAESGNVTISPGIPVNHQVPANSDWRKDSGGEFPFDPLPEPITRVGSVENMVAPTLFAEGTRRRKLSRREQEIEKRRQSDPTAEGRDDIDYGSDELPSVR